jgi:hypothetical protein
MLSTPQDRVKNIRDFCTQYIFACVSQGLFVRHRLAFAYLIAASVHSHEAASRIAPGLPSESRPDHSSADGARHVAEGPQASDLEAVKTVTGGVQQLKRQTGAPIEAEMFVAASNEHGSFTWLRRAQKERPHEVTNLVRVRGC